VFVSLCYVVFRHLLQLVALRLVPTGNSVCALRRLRDPPIKVFRQRLQGRETEFASPRTAAVHSPRTTGEYVPVWQRRGAMVRRARRS
jgi:hypothetical protein